MPEHLLYGTQVGPAFEEMRGEGMPEQVRMDSFRLEPGLGRQLAEDQECAGAPTWRPAHRRPRAPVAPLPSATQPRPCRAGRHAAPPPPPPPPPPFRGF